eukprot:scaffold207_cov409-Prasinococcus_capsulatus_cf.AAC.114
MYLRRGSPGAAALGPSSPPVRAPMRAASAAAANARRFWRQKGEGGGDRPICTYRSEPGLRRPPPPGKRGGRRADVASTVTFSATPQWRGRGPAAHGSFAGCVRPPWRGAVRRGCGSSIGCCRLRKTYLLADGGRLPGVAFDDVHANAGDLPQSRPVSGASENWEDGACATYRRSLPAVDSTAGRPNYRLRQYLREFAAVGRDNMRATAPILAGT